MADIVIIGSATMDMTAKSSLLPLPGQTVLGNLFVMGPGGKGANQAVAARRLGGNTHAERTGIIRSDSVIPHSRAIQS